MKRLMAIAALALAPLGCVANQGDAPIRFLWARALVFEEGIGCTASDDFVITEGTLDISGGQNYLLAMSVETNTFQQPITIGQEPMSGEGLGDITLNEYIYSYEFQPLLNSGAVSLTLPADEVDRLAAYAVFRPETDPEETYTFVRAFGPGALDALRNAITPGTAVTVLSTIKARGRLSGGQVVESNAFTFPVTVISSGFGGCADGEFASGACGIAGLGGPIVCIGSDAP
ncbi:hypothetical protein ACN28I_41010 [Archangium gephyra]|uniref:hypothetical protein n=1 Tax=Archangium gephyra TaxID=48 RepID=UPI003B7C3424